ncbi:hypothetical protein V8C43DRAFT_138743 [Trichoderma afarasin]
MPMIHTFVLWNCEKAHACAFIYRVENGTASVTWRGTWNFKLPSRVVEAWQVVASKRRMHRSELQLKQDDIKAAINCPGDAIYHLKLPCQVIEPASLWQIDQEGRTHHMVVVQYTLFITIIIITTTSSRGRLPHHRGSLLPSRLSS